MATENQTRATEKTDAPVAAKPTPDKSLHDPVQSMHEFLSLISKTGTEAVASLQNLATEALYGKPADAATTGGGTDSKGAAAAGKPREAGQAHDTVKAPGGTKTADAANSTDAGKPTDATKPTDAAKQKEIGKEHKQLSDWADHNLKEPKLSEFKKNMDSFEARAKSDKLDPDEVIKTYKQVERLNAATGDKPLSETQRHNLSGEIMHQAAEPTSIDQGNHNTCSAATVEVRTYTRTPSDAARLVTDVALTGEYRAPDGTHIRTDPRPHDESKSGTNIDGQRSHASEIFEVTAINLHYAKENAKNGTKIHYEQVTPTKGDLGDTGERLTDYSKNPPQPLKIDGEKVDPPHVDDNAVTQMSNIITGKNEKDVQIEQGGNVNGDTKGMVIVNSEAELKQQLKDAKDHNRLPMIVKVNTFSEPFNSDSFGAGAGGDAGSHVVTITDYDEKTGKVTVDNQWGKKNDHGKDDPLSTHELYIAMQKPEDAEKTIAADVKYNHEHGISDPVKEIELKRYEANLGGGDSIGRTSVTNSIHEMKRRWDKGGVSDAEKSKERHALNNLIAAMPMADQVTLIQAEHKAGIATDGQYENQVAILGIRMLKPTDNDPVTDMAKFDYKAALAALTPAQQTDVLGKIEKTKQILKHPELEPAFEKEFMAWLNHNEGK